MTRPVLVIVSGAPATGKSTMARALSSTLGYPLISKDILKEAIGDELGRPPDVPASQRMGLAAYRILHLLAAELVAAEDDVIIESNFRRGFSERELQGIVARSDARLVHCASSPELVRSRYAERRRQGDRHQVHLDAEREDGLAADLSGGLFEPLLLDIPVLIVKTDDGYEPALQEVVAFASRRATSASNAIGQAGHV